MARNAVTARYLEHVSQLGLDPGELPAIASARLDLVPTSYRGRCLSRPAFLSHGELTELDEDLRQLHAALCAIPERLFGGDLASFGRAAGLSEAQVTAVQRARSITPMRLGRADIYHDGTAFRLMEMNLGAAIGGFDNAIVNQALLTSPTFAGFVEEHKLSYVDSLAALVNELLVEGQVPSGSIPYVVIADWPESFVSLEPRLRAAAEAMTPLGIQCTACHLGQLEFRDGRVWLDGRPIDVIYRLFLIEDLLDPQATTLIDPVLRAVERGEVAMFAPVDVELYGSKAAIAMVSDEAHRHLLTDAQRASLDRLLPWTRMVRQGDVTLNGQRVDLWEYAVDQQSELVLKPTLLHGGLGVVLGWQVEPETWQRELRAAMDGYFVVQHRLYPHPELVPVPGGEQEMLFNWGVFTAGRGYAGAFVRASTDLTGGTMNVGDGATLGCCFHEAVASD